MKLILQVILVFCLIIPAFAQKRHALIIGNSSYKGNPLDNPVNDARDINAALKSLGFKVILKTNLDKQKMEDVVNEFAGELGETDIALFYYSGHGAQVDGINYLLPVNERFEDETDVQYNAVNASWILSKIERVNINIIILDACRDNPYSSVRSGNKGMAPMRAKPGGTYIVYATSPGRTASDGKKRNSPFTESLIKNIKTPNIKIEELVKCIAVEVSNKTGKRQVPWAEGMLLSDFYFAGKGKPAQQKRPQPVVTYNPLPAKQTANDNLVFVKGGMFQMGSNDGDNEKPVHSVTVSDFYMSKYEVTNAEYCEFLNEKGNQSEGGASWLDINSLYCLIEISGRKFAPKSGGDKHPVIDVTWYGAKAYCEWKGGRLPTEAEWEYAARGGNKPWGFKYAGSNNPDDVAWYGSNSGDKTHPVGQKQPNELGLYDMSGNVWEWCSDWYGENYYKNSTSHNPTGPSIGSSRVLRGGCWVGGPDFARVANRHGSDPNFSFYYYGFRIAKDF